MAAGAPRLLVGVVVLWSERRRGAGCWLLVSVERGKRSSCDGAGCFCAGGDVRGQARRCRFSALPRPLVRWGKASGPLDP